MIKSILFGLLGCLLAADSSAQIARRPMTHSHNDYEQSKPFWLAYDAGFSSIEADIFLIDQKLYVAHDSAELRYRRSLLDLYINPLLASMRKNNGFPYADTSRNLQILIDIKSESIHTLKALVKLLKQYPTITKCRKLRWVISGNRPAQELFTGYPQFIWFDGELWRNYSDAALSKIAMLSDDFERYSRWKADSSISLHDDSVLRSSVTKSHLLNKPVRFWDAPDNRLAWETLLQLQVDVINTDHINELQLFLAKKFPN